MSLEITCLVMSKCHPFAFWFVGWYLKIIHLKSLCSILVTKDSPSRQCWMNMFNFYSFCSRMIKTDDSEVLSLLVKVKTCVAIIQKGLIWCESLCQRIGVNHKPKV